MRAGAETRYFVGVAPPPELAREITRFARQWPDNRHPDHVEPHITVVPPFARPLDIWIAGLRQVCATFPPFPIYLHGADWFRRDVVYLKVSSQELPVLERALQGVHPSPGLSGRTPYTPHLTLAMRRFGLSRAQMEDVFAQAQGLGSMMFHAAAVRVYRKQGDGAPWSAWTDIAFAGDLS